MRRFARILGTLMIVAGLLMGAWAFTVWRWQDPFTAVLNHFEQRELSQTSRAASTASSPPPSTSPPSPWSGRAPHCRSAHASGSGARSRATRSRACASRGSGCLRSSSTAPTTTRSNGAPAATSSPRCPARASSSTSPATARPTAPPSRGSTASPRATRSSLELPYGTFEYRVTGHRIVPATQTSELRSRGFEQLALQACHPRFFASHRYIVYATPVRVARRGTEAAPLATG
jgi:hypothetical protein